ncbi:MAG: DEAD/DEAH box helicase family protein [Christensenellaceae bacterium]|jgi:type III restriction enzyme|nr:DEAD/DEAH box helicase family protein [Christensenellaceae bacterium]
MKNLNKMSVDAIFARMNLRLPQYESIKILDDICTNLDIAREDLKSLEKEINAKYPLFKEFEREFPSLTFAIATGVGKTRLMGASILYLYLNYGIKNFFVVAPNLTIYEKLKKDFGDPGYTKYVFKGIQQFAQNWPRLITGENYYTTKQGSLYDKNITINIFNIAKFNRGDELSKIKKVNENIGEEYKGYFGYLSKLPDLIMMMDESHHYRADAGFKALNELSPLLGLEFTATPQVEGTKGAVKFRNVVYEYSLARAIGNFVKTPWVATKKNFNAKSADDDAIDKIKLIDGLTIHRNTQAELLAYAENEGVRPVKPFVLVVCKDTKHATYIIDYIKSADFFDGYYNDKVIEIHSAQKGAEMDVNIEQLLKLEYATNKIEIVVHVNMLKEGWDVTNLYTIIPLRVAASLTLREQTIGRGLRLPYGRITGNETVDRLTIVAHDLFNDIVKEANNENSIIRKQHIIEIEDLAETELETIKPVTVFDETIKHLSQKQHFARSEKTKEALEEEKRSYELVGKAIDAVISKPVNLAISDIGGDSKKTIAFIPTTNDLTKPEVRELIIKEAMKIAEQEAQNQQQVFKSLDFSEDGKRAEIEKKIEEAYSPAIEVKKQFTIDIPAISIVATRTGSVEIKDFDIDPSGMYWFASPADEIVLENLKSGENKQIQSLDEYTLPEGHTQLTYIINAILNVNDLVDYAQNEGLLIKLATQFLEWANKKYATNKINGVLVANIKDIAKELSNEINLHLKVIPSKHEVVLVNTANVIQTETYTKKKGEEIKQYTDYVPTCALKKTVFDFFAKCCTNLCKFSSDPERIFSIILEKDPTVQKWLRPTISQLSITYGNGERYQPDFIVETDTAIYIIEIKAEKDMDDKIVVLKTDAAKAYCTHANAFNQKLNTNAKWWQYALISDYKVARNMTLAGLIRG